MKTPGNVRNLPAALLLTVFGWLVPGGGYLLMRRYWRFALNLLLVSGAFAGGLYLHGANLWPQPEDFQGLDGVSVLLGQGAALIKLMAGGPYLLARLCDYSQTFVGGRLHEYGTVLLVMAGLLNLMAVMDALELRKEETA